jgi:putative oxidoreductase
MHRNTIKAVALRYTLVSLFFPASMLDKIFNHKAAVAQAEQVFPAEIAKLMVLAGIGIEVAGPLAILTGKSDRAAAMTMAGYCVATAVLFKRFWEPGDFWKKGESKGRETFWDFLKNVSLAGGFLMITFGTRAAEMDQFKRDPLGSTKPYGKGRRR